LFHQTVFPPYERGALLRGGYFKTRIFDEETIVAKPGDTITVPPNVWHAASCEKGGKMLTIFKNGQFDLYLEKLSTLSDSDFADAELMASISAEFDIYEGWMGIVLDPFLGVAVMIGVL